jgi:hypothetical protein
MLKLKSLIKEEKNWFELQNELDPGGVNHDLTLICTRCGNTQTCRCSKPKRKVYGLCHKCAGIGYNGEKL